MALLLGGAVIPFQDLADDAGIGLLPSLSRGWAATAHSAADTLAAPNSASILRTVSRCNPNSRAASRMLTPSTITARRTRRYTSTLYIRRSTHRLNFKPMDDGGRSNLQPPILSATTRPHGPLVSLFWRRQSSSKGQERGRPLSTWPTQAVIKRGSSRPSTIDPERLPGHTSPYLASEGQTIRRQEIWSRKPPTSASTLPNHR